MKKQNIRRYIKKHYKKPAVVCGHGPSLNYYRAGIEAAQWDNKIIRFGNNNWWNFFQTPPDYWIMVSNFYEVSRMSRLSFDAYGKIPDIVYSDVMYQPSDTQGHMAVPPELEDKFNLIAFDHAHIHGQPCEPRTDCCELMNDSHSILELVSDISGVDMIQKEAITSVFHTILIAMVMGCNPIYISGVDLDWRLGYAKLLNEFELPPGFFTPGERVKIGEKIIERDCAWSTHIAYPGCQNWEADMSKDSDSFDNVALAGLFWLNKVARAMQIDIYNLNPHPWYGNIIPILPPQTL